MRHNRLFWFLIIFLCVSLACNLPGHNVLVTPGSVAEVTSVSVTPHSGTGNFTTVVEGTTIAGVPSELTCYVSPDKAGTKFKDDVSGSSDKGWSFKRSFRFSYTDPGTHTLVCLINEVSGTAWNEDFVVVTPGTTHILTITASDAVMTYGGAVPEITASYSGFVNDDTASSLSFTPTCETSATSHSMVGPNYTYCHGQFEDGIYTIKYVDGKMSVKPAALTITASSVTMDAGGSVPDITASYSGFVNGDTVSSVETPPTCSTTATSTSPAGPYPSSCLGAVLSPAIAFNYNISYVPGTVTIKPPTDLTALLKIGTAYKVIVAWPEGAVKAGSVNSTWTVTSISGNQVTFSTHWACCPGERTDKMWGPVTGTSISLDRICTGQGWTEGPCHQIYIGSLSNLGDVITGGITGDKIVTGESWTLYLNNP